MKIRCINRGEGCEWTGELGTLKTHLESERGCGFVEVECPNKCQTVKKLDNRFLMRNDLVKHLTDYCYLRPYQCMFCGFKDTYEAITGKRYGFLLPLFCNPTNPYFGHQAKCPEAPLPCPNECGSSGIKRKDMEKHRSKCPQEPVECPFAEAGCKSVLRRHQLEDHMTSSQQQHLMMVMKDYKQTKHKLGEAEAKISRTETELFETKQKLCETKSEVDEALARLAVAEVNVTSANRIAQERDSLRVQMTNFSKYRRSGKVWHSLPFYYKEGYKMCLAVYANGVGKGAGTHVSVSLVLLRGCYDDQLKWPIPSIPCDFKYVPAAYTHFNLSSCAPIQRAELNELKEITVCDQFCRLNSEALILLNDYLTLQVTLLDLEESILSVRIV